MSSIYTYIPTYIMKHAKKTYWGIGIGIVIAVLLGVFYWVEVREFQERQDIGEDREAFYEHMEQKREGLVKAYKNDTVGGETPQETWDMFIGALEAGDTEQASKYFVVEKQEEMKKQFDAGRENGAIDEFLESYVPRIKEGDYFENDKTKYRFVVIGTEGRWDGVVEFTYDLVLNEYTDVWKIESL